MFRTLLFITSFISFVTALNAHAAESLPYIDATVNIDGKLDEAVWQKAKKININNVTWPQENKNSPVKTTAYVFENGTSLFIAFDAKDPNPELIRAFYRDRDSAWNDDLVGIKIDSFNTQLSAYQLFINPLGVQQDSIENELTKSENSSWNGIWDSAGSINEHGYYVEVEIPLRILNFDDSQTTKTMAMEFLRFYPRSQRLRISNMQISHDNNCWICQMPTFTGFERAKQGNNLAFIPSLVTSKQQTRDIDDNIIDDWSDEDNVEPSLDLKWAITPDMTLNATLNPDFSQVEADTGQLSVNNSFSLFFPEKRAFFLDNSDYFSSHWNLIHTRNIASPDYGVKFTSSRNGHTLGAFIANDDKLNVLIPGNLGSKVLSFDQKSENLALRYRYDFNSKLNVGATTTARQGDKYSSKLVSVDGKYKLTNSDIFKAQLTLSNTDYSQDFVDELCDAEQGACQQQKPKECDRNDDCILNESILRVLNEDDKKGLGYFLNYEHNEKHWRVHSAYQYRDSGFRSDLGFISRIDFNKFVTGYEYRWYGNKNNWWNRASWYSDWDITHNENNELLEKEIESRFSINGPLQSVINTGIEYRNRVGLRHNEASLAIDGNTDLFSENGIWTYMEIKPVSGVFTSLNINKGNKVDLANNRLGKELRVRPAINLNLGKHFELRIRHTYQTLDAEGADVFTANLTDVRMSYQFNLNSYLRLAVISTDIERNINNYIDEVDANYKSLSTQLLYSYKLNPQTVFFAGYSDSGYKDDELSKVVKDEKTFFMKFSYAWLM